MVRYTWDAGSYEKHSSPQHEWALALINTLSFVGDERVLDIGCGDGKISAELAAHVPRGSVLGIDSAPTMIQYAYDKFPPSRVPNLRFQLRDATHLTFCDEFDLVVSFAALHWVHDHRAVLQGIKRALKLSGRAVLQFGGEGNAATLLAITDEVITHERWRRYFTGFTAPWTFYGIAPYRDLVNEAGLLARRIDLVPKDMTFREQDELNAWYSAVFMPYLERLPESQREAFTEEVAALHLERWPRDKHGMIHVPMVRLEVEVACP